LPAQQVGGGCIRCFSAVALTFPDDVAALSAIGGTDSGEIPEAFSGQVFAGVFSAQAAAGSGVAGGKAVAPDTSDISAVALTLPDGITAADFLGFGEHREQPIFLSCQIFCFSHIVSL